MLAVAGAVIVGVVFYAGAKSSSGAPPEAPRTAAIVDQLALTSPDPAFVWNATVTLQQAGYTVEYVPSEQVTVDLYRELPSRGYGLVVIRAHSGFVYKNVSQAAQEVRGTGETFLFTSERYSVTTYPEDLSRRRLSEALYFDPSSGAPLDPAALIDAYRDAPTYFGIKPGFVKSSTKGKFPRSTVILMGCNGLAWNTLAQAFVAKGAEAVVGWDDLVSAQHTDAATETLLQHLVVDKLPAVDAVARTAAEAGPDPTYGGKLTLYR